MNLPFGVKTVAFILNLLGVDSTPPVLPIRHIDYRLLPADDIGVSLWEHFQWKPSELFGWSAGSCC